MDLRYVQNYLVNLLTYSPDYIVSKVNELTIELSNYLAENRGDINDETYRHRVLLVLQQYEDDLKIRSIDFDATPSDKIKDRSFKAQGVLVTLSLLQTYLQELISNYSSVSSEDKFYKYLRKFREMKELYASMSVTWSSILKSISSEACRQTEIIKLKNI